MLIHSPSWIFIKLHTNTHTLFETPLYIATMRLYEYIIVGRQLVLAYDLRYVYSE